MPLKRATAPERQGQSYLLRFACAKPTHGLTGRGPPNGMQLNQRAGLLRLPCYALESYFRIGQAGTNGR